MARGVNKVILVGNLGADPEPATCRTARRSPTSASPRQRVWKDKQTGEQRSRRNGTTSSCTTGSAKSPRNTCARVRRSTSKASCARASGRTRKAATATPPKSTPTRCRCSAAARGGAALRASPGRIAQRERTAAAGGRRRAVAAPARRWRRRPVRRRHSVLSSRRLGEPLDWGSFRISALYDRVAAVSSGELSHFAATPLAVAVTACLLLRVPMPRVYIKTFGCQMNEYDSARMADVLRVAGGYEPTEDPAAGRPAAAQHLLGAREGAGEGVLAARPLERAQEGHAAPGHHRRRRLRREPGRRGHHRACAVRRPRVRAADASTACRT